MEIAVEEDLDVDGFVFSVEVIGPARDIQLRAGLGGLVESAAWWCIVGDGYMLAAD